MTKQNMCPLEGLADGFTLEEGNHRKTLETFLDGHLGWHRGDVVHVDCRGLYDPNGSTTHPGIHVGVIEGVVYHRKFDETMWDFLALLADILWGAETGELPRCVAPSQGGVGVWPPTSPPSARRVGTGALPLRPSFCGGLRPKGPKFPGNTFANPTGPAARANAVSAEVKR